MSETIQLGDIAIAVTRKDIKHVHLSVHPPSGRVTLVAPDGHAPGGGPRLRDLQARLDSRAAGEAARAGAGNAPPVRRAREPLPLGTALSAHRQGARREALRTARLTARITLTVRPGSSRRQARRRSCTSGTSPCCTRPCRELIAKWEPKLGVEVAGYFLQRMKTKWGSCNHRARHIRLNTELVKKPKDLLEYVVVHEMLHLIEPTHSERFVALLSKHYPTGARPGQN